MNVPTHPDRRKRIALGLGGAALLALGAAGGAGAIAMTRPHAEMAPTVPTTIARLGDARGVVTVRGRVAEVYGSRFVVQDATGRALVDTGRGGPSLRPGSPILVQGRFGDGELRARYLVDASGTVAEVGPPPPPPHGAGGSPPPPPPGAVPPPPPGGPAAPPPPVALARPDGGQMLAVSAGEAAAPAVQR